MDITDIALKAFSPNGGADGGPKLVLEIGGHEITVSEPDISKAAARGAPTSEIQVMVEMIKAGRSPGMAEMPLPLP